MDDLISGNPIPRKRFVNSLLVPHRPIANPLAKSHQAPNFLPRRPQRFPVTLKPALRTTSPLRKPGQPILAIRTNFESQPLDAPAQREKPRIRQCDPTEDEYLTQEPNRLHARNPQNPRPNPDDEYRRPDNNQHKRIASSNDSSDSPPTLTSSRGVGHRPPVPRNLPPKQGHGKHDHDNNGNRNHYDIHTPRSSPTADQASPAFTEFAVQLDLIHYRLDDRLKTPGQTILLCNSLS